MAKHSFLLLLVCFGGCSRALVQVKREPRSHDTSRIAWAKLMARAGRSFRSSARGSRVAHQPEDRCGGAIDRTILDRKTVAEVPLAGLSFPLTACQQARIGHVRVRG
jgi:hypothetical protein